MRTARVRPRPERELRCLVTPLRQAPGPAAAARPAAWRQLGGLGLTGTGWSSCLARCGLLVWQPAMRAAVGRGFRCCNGSVWGSRSRGRACSWTCTCCCCSCPPACTAASPGPPAPASSSSSTSSPGPPPSPPSRPRPNRPPHVPVLIAQLTSPPPSRPRPTRPPHAPGPPFSRPSPCVRPGDHVDSRRAGESACRRVGRAA